MNRACKASQLLSITVLLIVCLPSTGAFAQSSKLPRSKSQTSLFDYALKETDRLRDDWKRQAKRTYIAEKYAEAQQFDQALAVAETLYEEWYRAGALTKIAVSLWKAGQIQKSEQVLERVRKLKPRPNEIGSPTAGYERLSDLVTAYLETFQYAKAIETANLITYESSRIHQFEMILAAYSLGGQGELPETWLNDLLKLRENLELKPEKDAIRDAYSPDDRKRQVEDFEKIKELTISSITFRVALAYATKGDFKKAEELASQVQTEVDEQGTWHLFSRQTALSQIAMMYAEKGKSEDAFRVARLVSGRPEDRTWLLLAEEFASQNKPDLAQMALTEVMKHANQPHNLSHNIFILANAAVIYSKLGQIEKSELLFRSGLELVLDYKEDRHETLQYLEYIAGHAAISGNPQLALEALEAFKKISRDKSDYVFVLGSSGQNATTQKLVELVDRNVSEIITTVNTEHGTQNVRMLVSIAEGWLEVGEKEKAAQVLKSAITFRRTNPGYVDFGDFRRLAVAAAKAERIDLLMEFADSIKTPDREVLVESLADLGVEFAKRGWMLDSRQRKILDRLIGASKEPRRDGPPPPPMRNLKKRRR